MTLRRSSASRYIDVEPRRDVNNTRVKSELIACVMESLTAEAVSYRGLGVDEGMGPFDGNKLKSG
jgi:hypothetical protein